MVVVVAGAGAVVLVDAEAAVGVEVKFLAPIY